MEVHPKLWGCTSHWHRLPQQIRDRIWKTYVPGQEVRKDPSSEYLEAARAAQAFAEAEIAAGRDSVCSTYQRPVREQCSTPFCEEDAEPGRHYCEGCRMTSEMLR